VSELVGLNALVGRELSSVEFVRDYLQLRFDGLCLSAITMPVVRRDELAIIPGAVGYCDALVALIGSEVDSAVTEENKVLRVVFRKGVSIEISLRPEDYKHGPEAAILRNPPDVIWVW
jgi:hypothetical protein